MAGGVVRWGRVLAAVFLATVLIAGCTATGAQRSSGVSQPEPSAGKLTVVATTTIIADIARNVAGDRIEVKSLLPVGTDPHTFTPTPADVQTIADSGLVLYNGGGLESWLDRLVQNAGGQRPVVVVSEGIPVRQIEGEGTDPHFWLDVKNAMVFTRNIRDALIKLDPAGADIYRTNADAYLAKLAELDQWVQDQVEQIPPGHRKLVTNHDEFGYFAARYGFQVVGAVLGVTPGQEPSAQEVAQLIEKIKAAGVPAVFTETTVNPALADQIAADAGVKIVSQLYVGSLGPAGSGADTYIGMIRYDVATIVKALK
jgi:ABC-type Zn uptake system ZnuABC Zn-binding protein ZnuA